METKEGATEGTKIHEGATIEKKDNITSTPVIDIKKEESLELEVNAKKLPITKDNDKIKDTSFTTVPNSPVKDITPNKEPQSNPKVPINVITNYFSQ